MSKKSFLTTIILAISISLRAQGDLSTFVRSQLIDPPATFGSGFGNTVSGVDLDGDGKVEIYSVSAMSDFMNGDEIPQIIKYEFNGTTWDSVWAASFPNERQYTWASLTTGDLDGDGKMEIIWGYVNNFTINTTPPRIVVFENQADDLLGVSNGAGNFTPNAQWDMDVPESVNMRPLKWVATDIDNDGTQEIVFAERRDYYNFGIISTSDVPDNGDGSETWTMEFNAKTELYNKFVRSGVIPANGFEASGYGEILTDVDIDGDGFMDLFLCNNNSHDTSEEMNPRLYKYELVHGAWVLVWKTDLSSLIDAQNTWPSLNVADLDGDGKKEVVWNIINNFRGSSTTPARVVVFEASGDSTVDALGIDDGSGNYMPNAYWDYDVAASKEMRPLRVDVTDIDNDGKEEIVLAERKDYYGWLIASVDNIPDNGDGSETWTIEASGSGDQGGSSVYRDMTIMDGAIYLNSWYDDIVKVYWDGSNWVERAPQSVPFWSFKSMSTVDIDGDGTNEILAVNYSSPAKVYLLQEDTVGDSLLVTELADLADVGVSRAPGGDVGDIDGDGNIDFVIGGRNTDIIARLEYKGSGAITDPASYTLSVLDKGISPEAGAGNFEVIAFSDIDSDGCDEVFYTSGYQRGLTTGAFPLVIGHYADTLKADAGRRWDMVIANGMAHFFNGNGDIQTVGYADSSWFVNPSQKGVVNGAFLTASAVDVNGDGVEEVFVSDWYDAKVQLLEWSNGAWVAHEAWDFSDVGGYRLNGGATGDIDGDGNMEFVTGSRQSTPNGQIYRVEYLGGDFTDPASFTGEVIDQELNTTHTQYEVINVANLDDDPELEVLYTSDYARGPNSSTDPQVPLVILDKLTTDITPIAYVREDNDGDFIPDHLGERFTVKGIVTSPSYSSRSLAIYIQDSTAAIDLWRNSLDIPVPELGHEVIVTGTVEQFQGLTELLVESLNDMGFTGFIEPETIKVEQLLSNQESYEGELIRINRVSIYNDTWTTPGASKNMLFWDGYYQFWVRIDADTDLDDNPEPTWPVNLVGIVTQYDPSDPRNSGYQILLRYYDELEQNVPSSPNPHFYFTEETKQTYDGKIIEINSSADEFVFNWHNAVDLNGDDLIYQLLLVDNYNNYYGNTSPFNIDTSVTITAQRFFEIMGEYSYKEFTGLLQTTSQRTDEEITTSVDTLHFGVRNNVAQYVCGDVDCDGNVLAYDASLILQSVVNLINLDDLCESSSHAADVDQDLNVTAFDAALVLRDVVGLPEPVATCFDSLAPKRTPLTFEEKLKIKLLGVEQDKDELNAKFTFNNLSLSGSIYSIEFVAKLVNAGNISLSTEGNDYLSAINNINDKTIKIAVVSPSGLSQDSLVFTYSAKLKDVGGITLSKIKVNNISVEDIKDNSIFSNSIVRDYSLVGNYPNPFNPSTNIRFEIPQKSFVRIKIYNILGRLVKTLVQKEFNAGRYNIRWDGRDDYSNKVSSGVYFAVMQAGSFKHSIKMNLIK